MIFQFRCCWRERSLLLLLPSTAPMSVTSTLQRLYSPCTFCGNNTSYVSHPWVCYRRLKVRIRLDADYAISTRHLPLIQWLHPSGSVPEEPSSTEVWQPFVNLIRRMPRGRHTKHEVELFKRKLHGLRNDEEDYNEGQDVETSI